jgi:hypothetical protein
MNCEYCGTSLKTLSSLKLHQKTAKYCLSQQTNTTIEVHSCNACSKKFNRKSSLDNHLKICKETTFEHELRLKYENREKELIACYEKDRIIQDKDRIIQEQKLIIEEQKNIIKEFQEEYKNKLEKQNKDLTDRIQSMAEKAIAKPSTLNQNTTNQIINNMMPITDAHLQEHVQNLNPVHVQNGASGYAKYALEYPLKDMIVCTDFQRRNCKYKDENGNVVSDPEMTKITKRLFSAIKERNEELINEYSAELQAKWRSINESGNPGMDQEECDDFASKTNAALEFAMDILSQKRQASEMADGMRPDLFYGFVRELAAGCYRSEKC